MHMLVTSCLLKTNILLTWSYWFDYLDWVSSYQGEWPYEHHFHLCIWPSAPQ